MNKLADAVNPEADDEFSYHEDPGLPSFVDPYVHVRVRRQAEAARTSYFDGPTYNDAVGIAWPKEHLLHRLEDVAATFGVDLEDRTNQTTAAPHDPVHHPSHYTSHPSGVECIDVAEHWTFCLGNALKYLWRAGSKGDTVEDLEKSVWYIRREIERLSS